MKLQDHLPVDHKLALVYRIGAGLGGLFILIWGIVGLLGHPSFLSTHGQEVAGLSSNGSLSVLSIVVGGILVIGALVGGNVASNVNMVIGLLFVLGGFAGLAVLDRPDANFLAFRIPNVIFSFAFGFTVLTFGMYGRVSSHLPKDNPYWRKYHEHDAELPSGPWTFVRLFKPGPPNPTGR